MQEKLNIKDFVNFTWTHNGYDFEKASIPGCIGMKKISIIPVFKVTQKGTPALIYHFSHEGACIDSDRLNAQSPDNPSVIDEESCLAVNIVMKDADDLLNIQYEKTHYFSFNSGTGREIEMCTVDQAKCNAATILCGFLTTDKQKKLLNHLTPEMPK